jgi:hypothetical protein
MKIPSFFSRLTVLASINVLVNSYVAAQDPDPEIGPDMITIQPPTEIAENIINEYVPLPQTAPLATVIFPDNWFIKTRCTDGLSPMMGISATETVNVQVTFPPTVVGQTITVEALDGGMAGATKTDETLGVDGVVPFNFTAGDQPGLYRIVVKVGDTSSTLQFWITDPDNPDETPPLLAPRQGSPGPR